jgi:hypothetical protein
MALFVICEVIGQKWGKEGAEKEKYYSMPFAKELF